MHRRRHLFVFFVFFVFVSDLFCGFPLWQVSQLKGLVLV
jgi:hypothetical protein